MIVVIGSVFGALFHKKGNMPLEPAKTVENVKTNETPPTGGAQTAEFKGEYAFLQELASCDETQAVEIAKIFEDVTGHKLEKAESVSTEKSYILLKVDTPEKSYYLTISMSKLLRMIREDSVKGKIIYQIIF